MKLRKKKQLRMVKRMIKTKIIIEDIQPDKDLDKLCIVKIPDTGSKFKNFFYYIFTTNYKQIGTFEIKNSHNFMIKDEVEIEMKDDKIVNVKKINKEVIKNEHE